MAISDVELVEICNHGDVTEAERAFNTLYQRHKSYVIRVALRYVSDNDMALDVLQETFTYLLKKFPPTGDGLTLTSQLTTLLYPVAKNSALTLLQKAGRFPTDTDQQPDDLPAPEIVEAPDIGGLLGELSEERREVIRLRFVDDMSLQEISDTLKVPLGTVKSRLHLAIKQLRDSPAIKKSHFS